MEEKKRNQIIATNIKILINQKGITQKELANAIGISPSTLTDYMKLRSNPSHGVIQKIADYFGVVKSDIDSTYKEESPMPSTTLSLVTETTAKLDGKRQTTVLNVARKELDEQEQEKQNNVISLEQRRQKRLQQKMANFCHAGSVSAGTGEYLGDETIETIELPEDMIPIVADFCLTINGNSMEPIFADHSYVFVEKQAELPNGAIGIVVVNGEAFLKRIWFEDDHAMLESFNDDYEDIIVSDEDDFRIIGKVVM